MLKVEPFTYADLQTFFDQKRREVISGKLFTHLSSSPFHQLVLGNIAGFVWLHLRAQSLGELFITPTDMILSDADVVVPDIMFITKEHKERIKLRGVEGTADWVIEIISPSSREHDLVAKRKLYAQYGVQVYWVVDPDAKEIIVWEGEQRRVYHKTDTARVSLLPDFSLELAQIFPD